MAKTMGRPTEKIPGAQKLAVECAESMIERFESDWTGPDPVRVMYLLITNFVQTHPGGPVAAFLDITDHLRGFLTRGEERGRRVSY